MSNPKDWILQLSLEKCENWNWSKRKTLRKSTHTLSLFFSPSMCHNVPDRRRSIRRPNWITCLVSHRRFFFPQTRKEWEKSTRRRICRKNGSWLPAEPTSPADFWRETCETCVSVGGWKSHLYFRGGQTWGWKSIITHFLFELCLTTEMFGFSQ